MATGRLEWSDELFGLYGLDPRTATAGFDIWRSVIHPDDRALAEKRIDEAIQNYTSLNSEYRIVLPSGQIRWVNALGNTIYDDIGSPQRMSGICIDITERKQAEETLRESDEWHRTILHTVMDGFWVTDMQGRLLEVNDAYCRMSGYSQEELINRRISDLEAVLTRDDIAARIQTIAAKGEDRFETRHRRKDGGFLDWRSASSIEPRRRTVCRVSARHHRTIPGRTEGPPQRRTVRDSFGHGRPPASKQGSPGPYQDPVREGHEASRLRCLLQFSGRSGGRPASPERLGGNSGGSGPENRMAGLWRGGLRLRGAGRLPNRGRTYSHNPRRTDGVGQILRHSGLCLSPAAGSAWRHDLGTLSFGTRSRETFREDELSMMKTVADYVATALTRLRYEKSLFQQNADLLAIRKKLENEQHRLEGVMNVLPVGMAILDASGGNILSNKAFEEIWGQPRPPVRDIRDYAAYKAWWVDTGKPVEPEEWASAKAIRNAESVFNQFLKIQRFDGSTAYVLNSATPVLDGDGQIVAGTVAIQDVTALQNAQEVLRQSREDLDRAQAVGNIGSWRLDTQRNILTWSPEAHRIFGIPEGTPLTYETFLSTIHPDDRDLVDTKWKEALRGGNYDIEHRIIAHGATRWVREKAYLEFDAEGELIGGFGITQDITERKRMELELRQARDLLEKRVEERTRDLARTTRQLRPGNRVDPDGGTGTPHGCQCATRFIGAAVVILQAGTGHAAEIHSGPIRRNPGPCPPADLAGDRANAVPDDRLEPPYAVHAGPGACPGRTGGTLCRRTSFPLRVSKRHGTTAVARRYPGPVVSFGAGVVCEYRQACPGDLRTVDAIDAG